MAVKAKAQITISRIVDIESVTRYYLLQSSTAAAPAIPTANPPGGNWVKTEPSYTTGSTNTLYFVDLTLFTNGTYSYSAVSKSSSYEAAKAAYNKANAAADTANAAKDKIDNLQVGGRNLLLNSSMMKGELGNADNIDDLNSVTKKEYTDEGYHIITPSTGNQNNGVGFIFNDFTKLGLQPGDTISVGFDVKGSSDSHKPFVRVIFYASGNQWAGSTVIQSPNAIFIPTSDFQRVTYTYTIPADGTYTNKTMMLAFHGSYQSELWIKNIKLEKGSVATDWTEAPEDTDSKISDVDDKLSEQIDSKLIGRNFARKTSDQWTDWWVPKKDTDNNTINFSSIYPGNKNIGDVFRVSFDIEFAKFTTSTAGTFKIWFQGKVDGVWSITNPFIMGNITTKALADDHVEHISYAAKIATQAQADAVAFMFGLRCDYSDGTGKIRIRNLKVEKGSVETPWIPALEDSTANVYNEYYQSTSQSSLSGGSWSTSSPAWEQGRYIWSRTVIVDGAGNKTCRPSEKGVCIAGAKGDTGAAGNGITDSLILYAPSSDGINPPAEDNGDWTDHIEGLPDGVYLWVRVIYYYSDGTEKSVYSVSKNGDTGAKGDKGETGNGIKSTSITYQAHSSQTSVPTGTWLTQDAMPTLSADKPYLWTRVIYTYTDGTSSSPIYTVGSTLDGIQIGGTQLISLQNLTAGLLSTTGTLSTPTVAHKTSDYIPVLANEKYVASTNSDFASNGYMTVCWYNSSKTFLSCAFRSQALKGKYCNVITSPSTAAYARVSFPDANKKTVKFERGNIASDWSANPADVDARIDEVEQAASNAQDTADGKNTVFYQISKPSTSNRKINDIWFDTDDGNAMYYWSGSAWTKKAFGSSSIAAGSISTNHLVASAITTAKIAANAITTAKLATDAIKSSNYAYSSGSYSAAGTFLDLKTGLFRSKNFAIDADGNAYFKGTVSSEGTAVGGGGVTYPTITELDSSRLTFSYKSGDNVYQSAVFKAIPNEYGVDDTGGLTITVGRCGINIERNSGYCLANFGIMTEGSGECATNINTDLGISDDLYFTSGKGIKMWSTLDPTNILTFTKDKITAHQALYCESNLAFESKSDKNLHWYNTGVGIHDIGFSGKSSTNTSGQTLVLYDWTKKATIWSAQSNGKFQINANVSANMVFDFGSGIRWNSSSSSGWIYCGANQQMYIGASSERNYFLYLGVINKVWTLCPNSNVSLTLGTASYKWGQIYSSVASISTSDRNEKNSITTLNEDLCRKFIMGLRPSSYKMNNGTSGRTHFGLIAQDVENAMTSVGLTDMDFAGFCKDQKTRQENQIVVNEDGSESEIRNEIGEYDSDGNPVYIYGLRYEEFIAPLIATVQAQQKEIDELKKILNMEE